MTSHLLIAVDAFKDRHVEAFVRTLEGWGTLARIAESAHADEYHARLADTDVAVGWMEPEWLLPHPIKLLLCPSVGYEAYLHQGLEAKPGFTFCNAGSVYSDGLAEHCLALMFSLARRLPEYVRAMQTRTWHQLDRHTELAGSTVCIIGLGSMGMAIAHRCSALGMTVIAVRRSIPPAADGVKIIYPSSELRHAVATADHVIAALPGSKATKHLIDHDIFSAMKPGAYFYNLGRGSTVDEGALITYLVNGHIRGAGLDVFAEEPLPESSPLWSMDNVIITPHMAGFTADYADRLVAMMCENLRRYHADEPLLNVIDLAKG